MTFLRGGDVGTLTWSLIQDVGLQDQVLEASDAGGKVKRVSINLTNLLVLERYIIRNGSLVQVGLKDLLAQHPRVVFEPFQAKGTF